MGRATIYARINPGSVNLETLPGDEGYIDQETGQTIPLAGADKTTGSQPSPVPAILQKRFGVLLDEGEFCLKLPWTGIQISKNVRRGAMDLLNVPSEFAEQVKQTLEGLRALNGRQIWNVAVVYREETGHSPAVCGSYVEGETEPLRRFQEPPAIGSGRGVRPVQPVAA